VTNAVADGIIFLLIVGLYWVLGYGYLYGYAFGGGGVVCLWMFSYPALGVLLGMRGRPKDRPGVAWKLNLWLSGALLVLTVLFFVLAAARVFPWS
jgi:hypothetical protein